MKKKNATQWTKSSNVGRPRRTSNFCATFSSINEVFAVVQKIPCGYCVCLLLSLCCPEETILSTSQRTACVGRICWHPFRHLSTPTEEYCEMNMPHDGSVQTPHTFCVETRTIPHLCIANRPASACVMARAITQALTWREVGL